METLGSQESQGDWGKIDSEDDKVGYDQQKDYEDDEQYDEHYDEDPSSLDIFTVDPTSKSKDKVVIALSMKKFMFLQIKENKFTNPDKLEIDKDKHNQFFYARYNLAKFIQKLFEHPRAIVVFATSKYKKNASEIFTNIQQHLEREFESDENDYIDHLNGTFMYQENSAKTHNFEDGREEKVRDISKMIDTITKYYKSKGTEVDIKAENFIFVETEKQK